MQTAMLNKILASSTLQAAVMKHFRVESETQWGQPQPGPWAHTWYAWGCPCPLSPPQHFFPQATLALSGFLGRQWNCRLSVRKGGNCPKLDSAAGVSLEDYGGTGISIMEETGAH